jgi:serine/threonine-protein kinase
MTFDNSQFSILNAQLTGTLLGNYEVRELLDSGGMATVYKGYDPALDREVAIKVLGTASQPPDFVARFQREARVAARLRHPNIVQIYHFGVQRNVVYMVQELLPGPTLARRIREAGRRRMAPERVHTIVAQLAAALDFAHGQGVIHRDVKPSNAIYNVQGQLVLTDFGIARGLADAAHTSTSPGVIMGTPGYLAPEQAISSATLTPASDIYALGVVLFELLTGRLPFEADTPMGVVLKHLYEDARPPSSLRPDLPAALDTLVLRALSKEPSERFTSAGALAQALATAWPIGRAAGAGSQSMPRQRAVSSGARSQIQAVPKPGSSTKARGAQPAVQHREAKPPARKTLASPAAQAMKATERPAHPADYKRRVRVGLLTADIVGALLLFGTHPDALAEVWNVLQRLVGG